MQCSTGAISQLRAARGVRLDTQGTFTSAASWTSYDTTPVVSGVAPYYGGGYDGRYIYLVSTTVVLRYDTQADYGTAASWLPFDTTTLMNANFPAGSIAFAGFDGRYVYTASFSFAIGRYDTLAGFTDASSWSIYTTPFPSNQPGGFVARAVGTCTR